MLILAADTSLPLLSVALLRDETLIGALALEGKGSRNEKLLPSVDWLLSESGTPRESIDLFAVTRGPGSFTGVRIGLATLQGLALVLGKPVCAMSTHEAIASEFHQHVVIVDDAGREQPRRMVSAGEDGAARTARSPRSGCRPTSTWPPSRRQVRAHGVTRELGVAGGGEEGLRAAQEGPRGRGLQGRLISRVCRAIRRPARRRGSRERSTR